MSNLQIQVIDAQTEDNLTGIIIDGVPYLYWLRVYQALGIRKEHAPKIISRLAEGIHYRKFTRDEFALLSGTVDVTATVFIGAKSFVFLTAEGYNRAIMEITESRLNDPEVAAAINAKKDKMASIFTRYQSGETLSLATDQTPALMGEVTTDPEKQIRLYNTARKIAISLGADRRAINTVMIEKIKEECPEVYPFMAMIPQGNVSDSPDDAVLTRKEVSGILKIEQRDLEERIINVGWVNKTALGWLLTPKGTKYLKPDPHAGNKKVWYDVRFGLDAIRLLKQEFEQQVLTGGYLSSGQSKGYLPDLIPTGRNKKPCRWFSRVAE